MLAAHAPAPMMAPRALGKEAVQSEAALNTLAPSQAAHEAVAREGDTSASYMLPEMVTLAAGKTYAAPFIDTEVQTQKVSLRSEEHTSELQSLMRISYAVFCLKKKTQQKNKQHTNNISTTAQ